MIYDNTNGSNREYQALIFQSGYRFAAASTVGAHYTLQLKNEGNFAGEAANQPGMPSVYGDFPEIFGPALNRSAAERSSRQTTSATSCASTAPTRRAGPLRLGGSLADLARQLGSASTA